MSVTNELGALVGAQHGQPVVDPAAVAHVEQTHADRPAPGGVGVRCGQQDQLRERGVGEAFTDPLLLGGDHLGGGLADRQPAVAPKSLVVVVDQHRGAVGVAVQAVPPQLEDLFGPPAGVHEQFDRDPDLAARGPALEQRHPFTQLPHDRGGDVPAGLPAFGLGGDVTGGEDEVLAQPGGRAAGAGQPQCPDPAQDALDVPTDLGALFRAALAGRDQVGQPVEERFDVTASQGCRVGAVVGAVGAQALRQSGQAADQVGHHVAGAAPAPARQLIGGPPLGSLAQPGLTDPGEPQPPTQPEHLQLPHVQDSFRLRVGEGEPGMAGQCPQHRPFLLAHPLGRVGRQRVHGVGLQPA